MGYMDSQLLFPRMITRRCVFWCCWFVSVAFCWSFVCELNSTQRTKKQFIQAHRKRQTRHGPLKCSSSLEMNHAHIVSNSFCRCNEEPVLLICVHFQKWRMIISLFLPLLLPFPNGPFRAITLALFSIYTPRHNKQTYLQMNPMHHFIFPLLTISEAHIHSPFQHTPYSFGIWINVSTTPLISSLWSPPSFIHYVSIYSRSWLHFTTGIKRLIQPIVTETDLMDIQAMHTTPKLTLSIGGTPSEGF